MRALPTNIVLNVVCFLSSFFANLIYDRFKFYNSEVYYFTLWYVISKLDHACSTNKMLFTFFIVKFISDLSFVC